MDPIAGRGISCRSGFFCVKAIVALLSHPPQCNYAYNKCGKDGQGIKSPGHPAVKSQSVPRPGPDQYPARRSQARPRCGGRPGRPHRNRSRRPGGSDRGNVGKLGFVLKYWATEFSLPPMPVPELTIRISGSAAMKSSMPTLVQPCLSANAFVPPAMLMRSSWNVPFPLT